MASPVTITTRLGTPIFVETIPHEPTKRKDAYVAVFSRKFPRNILRVATTSAYNCIGMLFACRRGFVEDTDIYPILKDDGFRPIRPDEQVQAGDIVIWGATGNAEHVGLVIAIEDQGIRVPLVLSKWGPGPEYIHLVHDTPCLYAFSYYTERP
jgi:hypothetical protein